jgi:hypothetical protein
MHSMQGFASPAGRSIQSLDASERAMHPELDVNGAPPELAGAKVDALLIQPYLVSGATVDPVGTVHLLTAGEWHRLYFDSGIVFWRRSEHPPEPWADLEKGWDNPLVDLGHELRLLGSQITRYEMSGTKLGSSVRFHFADGASVIFDNANDRTTLTVTGPNAVV